MLPSVWFLQTFLSSIYTYHLREYKFTRQKSTDVRYILLVPYWLSANIRDFFFIFVSIDNMGYLIVHAHLLNVIYINSKIKNYLSYNTL